MRAVTTTALVLGMSLLATSGLSGTTASPDPEASSTVQVDLLVHTDLAGTAGFAPGEPQDLVGTATCSVGVPSGSDAGDVLDQAVTDGCILEWDYTEFDGDRFVESVDGLRAVGLTCIAWPTACQWWEFRVDEAGVGYGINDYSAGEHGSVEFFFHSS